MLLEAILHKPYSEYAFPIDENTLVLRIRTKKDDLNNLLVVFYEKFDPVIKGSELMEKVLSDAMYDYYEVKLCKNIKRFKYIFYLESAFEHKWLSANGFFNERPEWGYFGFSNICRGDIILIPDWLKNAVIYQIFPDRFYNSNLDVHSTEFEKGILGKIDKFTYFGGTLKGIIQKIEYLKTIGINTLYLNPVFKASSYHRYDTADYLKIDPLLGTEEDFKELIKICHQNGIRIVLDAVFNHCGPEFYAFKDVLALGENSRYKHWFCIKDFPLKTKPLPNYECFGFYGGMPKLDTTNIEVQRYFNEVVTYWLEEYDIDGFRFDAADEIDHNFWRLIRNTVKSIKKEAVLIGEIWDEAYTWLGGDQFDSVLNYPLKALINDLIAYKSISVEQFKERLSSYLFPFKLNIVNSLINIIGTHDTERFLTLCKGNLKRFEIGLVLQFTLPGIPLVYYGDEIGMTGGGDPHCRQPMIWDERHQNKIFTEKYKFLIDLRKDKILINGSYKEIKIADCKNILAYMRILDNESIIILINTSDKTSKGHLHFPARDDDFGKMISLKDKKQLNLENKPVKIILGPYEWDIYIVEIFGKLV